MFKKRVFGIMAVLAALALVFALVGCGGADGGPTGGGGTGGNGEGGGNGGGTSGVVTINNLPTVQTSISVGVFDYQGVFNSKSEYDTVIKAPGAGSIAATRFIDMPIMTQPVTIYNREGFSFTTVFTGTGQYLVEISTGNEATLDEPRYYGQVTFTNGNATVNYNNPTFDAGMLGGK